MNKLTEVLFSILYVAFILAAIVLGLVCLTWGILELLGLFY